MRLACVPKLVIVLLMILGLGLAVEAQGPAKEPPAGEVSKQEGPKKDEAKKEEPKKETPKKPKEQKKIFCATKSEPMRALMIDNVNCDDLCKGVFREYQCDTNQYLKDGWKITSFAPQEKVVSRPPCECKITGTEAEMER